MSVAVKNSTETAPPGLLERFPIATLAGVFYTYAAFAVVFYGLPALWWKALGLVPNAVNIALLGVVMLLAALGLLIAGIRILNNAHREGLRAAIFTVFLAILASLAIASGVGMALEGHAVNAQVGVPATAGLLVVLLVVIGRMLSAPAFEDKMKVFEAQGWFTGKKFKAGQGKMVRRGTIVGILVLAICGIYTLWTHQTLAGAAADWELPVPYTYQVVVTKPGDTGLAAGSVVSLAEVNEQNKIITTDKVKITNRGDSNFENGKLVPREEFQKVETELGNQGKIVPAKVTPAPADFETYPRLMVLPQVRFTLPIVLFAFSLWFAYRVVNYPVFADFLIATEAEMNKVSWTSRKNLVQDTVVVLVTVVLLTAFLFVVDQLWALVLTQVNVIQQPPAATKGSTEPGQEVPW